MYSLPPQPCLPDQILPILPQMVQPAPTELDVSSAFQHIRSCGSLKVNNSAQYALRRYNLEALSELMELRQGQWDSIPNP